MREEYIKRITLEALLKNFTPFREDQTIFISKEKEGTQKEITFIVYRANPHTPMTPQLPPLFDLNIKGELCIIADFKIQEDSRRRGYGRQMLEAVKDIARNLGCRELDVVPGGEGTLKFYLAMGFREREDNRGYYALHL